MEHIASRAVLELAATGNAALPVSPNTVNEGKVNKGMPSTVWLSLGKERNLYNCFKTSYCWSCNSQRPILTRIGNRSTSSCLSTLTEVKWTVFTVVSYTESFPNQNYLDIYFCQTQTEAIFTIYKLLLQVHYVLKLKWI